MILLQMSWSVYLEALTVPSMQDVWTYQDLFNVNVTPASPETELTARVGF